MSETEHGQAMSAPAARAAVPPDVGRLAADRGLGGLVDVRAGVTPLRALAIGWGMAAVAFALMWLISATGVGVLMIVAVFFFFVFLYGVVYGIAGLVQGQRINYLYSGGIVHRHRGRLEGVAWPQVLRLTSFYNKHDKGRLLGYVLETQAGTSFKIPLVIKDGSDPFVDVIVAGLRQHGRPIV